MEQPQVTFAAMQMGMQPLPRAFFHCSHLLLQFKEYSLLLIQDSLTSKDYHYKTVYKKIVILQSIGIIAIISSETMSVNYTCRYSNGHFSSLIIHTCFFMFFVTIIIFGELTSATSNERMTTNIIFVGATPIN